MLAKAIAILKYKTILLINAPNGEAPTPACIIKNTDKLCNIIAIMYIFISIKFFLVSNLVIVILSPVNNNAQMFFYKK